MARNELDRIVNAIACAVVVLQAFLAFLVFTGA